MRQDSIRIGVAHVVADPNAPKASNDAGSDEMRVLTDPTRENDGIDARKRCRCGGDGGSGATDEHVDRETRHRIAGRRATFDLTHVGRAGDGGEPGAMPHPVSQLLDGHTVGGEANRMPGWTDPARVPIISPSYGVKPIGVSTERPPSIAVTEQPEPRCATTSARSSRERSSSSDARRTAQVTERP